MRVEIITVGSELLLGEILNTNSQYLSEELNRLGYSVLYQTTVGDNKTRLAQALQLALQRADLVITSGGLGPTQGDLTKFVGAQVMRTPLYFDEGVYKAIEQWLQRRYTSPVITENQKRQAMIPQGATVFSNEAGTAPGTALQKKGKTLVHLPGPPRELQWMFRQRLKPYLLRQFGSQGYIASQYIKVYDLGESLIEERLSDLERQQQNPTLAIYARPGFVEVRITAKAASEEAANTMLQPLQKEVERRLARRIVTYNKETVAHVLGRLLKAGHWHISAAESCTGGLIGALLTDIPGASDYFLGTIGTYTDEMKQQLVHVPASLLASCTAISAPVASAMAVGSRQLYGADIALSTTGLAGPGGGTETRPIGLVYTGVSGPWGTVTHKNIYMGDRREIKLRAAVRAIYYGVQYILKHSA